MGCSPSRVGLCFVPVLVIAMVSAGAQDADAEEQRVATPMQVMPATLCADGCETLGQRRRGRVRVRVVEVAQSDVPADGTTLWLVVKTSTGSYVRALGSGGIACGGDSMIMVSVAFESLRFVDFEGGATKEIVVDWRDSGAYRTAACSLEHGVPRCADAGPAAPAELSRRSYPGSGRIRYGAADTEVVISFAPDGG